MSENFWKAMLEPCHTDDAAAHGEGNIDAAIRHSFPEYTIRRSLRAKHLRISINPHGEVEVIVPRRTSLEAALAFVQSKKEWIRAHLQKIAKHRSSITTLHERFPKQLDLRALHEIWRVHYHNEENAKLAIAVKTDVHEHILTLKGNTHDAQLCHQALLNWTKNKARKFLSARIQTLSETHNLPFKKLSLRNQKTRWGSCTAAHAIALNFKLIFFPPSLVDHVILHELCHTRYLDHSSRFWQLLEQHDPDTPHLRKELKVADHYVPLWMYEKS